MKAAKTAVLAGLLLPFTGCLVAGYSTGGGWYVWPGSIGITLLLVALMLFLNRR